MNPSMRRAFTAAGTTLALLGAMVVAGPLAPAAADTAPADPLLPQTVAADVLPTVQINGVVWDQEVVGNTVYVAGSFSSARPAGSPAGVNEVARANMLAYDIRTGVLISSFNPTFNAQVQSISASPDGSRIFVGGDFTTVNGQTQYRVAALNPTTGAPIANWRPAVNFKVGAVEASGSTVYIGGYFTAVGASARLGLAAVTASTGALLPWAPTAENGRVQALQASPDGTKVVVSGTFTSLNGSANPGYGLGMVDAVTGAILPTPVNSLIRNAGGSASIMSLAGDAEGFYGSGYTFGGGGNFEGTFQADWNGNLIYLQDCHGDSYSVWPDGDVVYVATHAHYCNNVEGGHPQETPWGFQHANVFTNYPTTPIQPEQTHYFNFAGQPGPTRLHFNPIFQIGTYTGSNQATWDVTGNADYILYGGEFLSINGTPQQGLVRFGRTASAPNDVGPSLSGPSFNPRVLSYEPGAVRVSSRLNVDPDNETLTYRVYRGAMSTLVDTKVITARYWDKTAHEFVDTGLPPGSSQRYRVTATDPFGNVAMSDWVTVTVATTPTVGAYAAAVLADGAEHFWRLSAAQTTATGTTVADLAGFQDAAVGTGVTFGAAGAVGDADTAAVFNGTTAARVNTPDVSVGPDVFTIEAWVNTTSTRGGKIVGYGLSETGNSSKYDRHVYMDNAGRLIFGVNNGAARIVNTTASYNDGQWHHVVASLGPDGMALYVDGRLAAARSDVTRGQIIDGFWRIGGDNLNGWPSAPSSRFLNGQIDDVAIYYSVLPQSKVADHYARSGRALEIPPVPTDLYGSLVRDANPDLYWRLDETSGAVVADSGANANPGIASATGVTPGVAGALATGTGTAYGFNGSSGFLASQRLVAGPATYTQELWFQTTTTSGGKLIGFGSAQTGLSGSYDRHVYMENDGRLTFGVYTGSTVTVTSPTAYNDGQWHHMVASQSAAGMRLYVDGELVGTNPTTTAQSYNGYWKVGADRTWGPQPYFNGTIDEVAVYSYALPPSAVASHFSAGNEGLPPNELPAASFTADITLLDLEVDGAASTDPDGTLATYDWDFGDGASATGPTAEHTYAAPGTYTVTLTVTDNRGGTATTTREVEATVPPPNQPPTASFVATPTLLDVAVDASASADPDGTVVSYAWEFGDGGTATGPTATHTYAAPGTYTVTLTVTDDDGATATTTRDVEATVPPPNQVPTASFTASATLRTVAFDASASTDPDGTLTSYAWNFGDGTSATGATTSKTYALAGTYTVTLTVTDDDGATATTTQDVIATDPPPVTELARDAFGRTTTSGWGAAELGGVWTVAGGASNVTVGDGVGRHRAARGATVASYLEAVSSTDTDVRVQLSLDKPQTGGGTYVSVLGRKIGTANYAGRLRLLATGQVQLAVLRTSTTLQSITVPGLTYTAGQQLQMRVQVVGTSPTLVQAKVWRVGDAEPAAWQVSVTDSGAGLQSSGSVGLVSYLSGSSTEVPMTVSFDNFVAGPSTATPPVPNAPPVAAFTATPTQLQLSVDGSTSSDADGSVVGHAWAFGDGATATGATASHVYGAAGTYQVTLTVTDDDGATAATTQQVVVTAPADNLAPAAAFTVSRTDLTVAVDGSTSSDPDGSIVGYAWTFGDGATATGATATRTYAVPGTYAVTLTVTDSAGATASTTQDVTVTAPLVTQLAADAFGRTSSAGWGPADVGGAWTLTGGATNVTVGDGVGRHRMGAGTTISTYLQSVASTGTDLRLQVSLDKAQTGGGTYFSAVARRVGTSTYAGRLRFLATGQVQLAAMRDGTALQTVTLPGFTYSAGDQLEVRVRVRGTSPTTVEAKVWRVGDTEPAAWQVSATDATPALQAAGSVGIISYLSGSATNAPVTVAVDNLTAVAAE